jgi:hypothetical protein
VFNVVRGGRCTDVGRGELTLLRGASRVLALLMADHPATVDDTMEGPKLNPIDAFHEPILHVHFLTNLHCSRSVQTLTHYLVSSGWLANFQENSHNNIVPQ